MTPDRGSQFSIKSHDLQVPAQTRDFYAQGIFLQPWLQLLSQSPPESGESILQPDRKTPPSTPRKCHPSSVCRAGQKLQIENGTSFSRSRMRQ